MPDASESSTEVGELTGSEVDPGSYESPSGTDPTHPEAGSAPKSEGGPQRPRRSKARSGRRRILEWAAVVVLAVLVAGGLRTFVVQAFYVPSGSMLPTLQIGDRIVVIKFGYTIHRGDIVVFKRPPSGHRHTDADLVKRVIGLPGETISSRGNTVLINGRPLKEPWLPPLRSYTTSDGVVDCSERAENIPRPRSRPGTTSSWATAVVTRPTAAAGGPCLAR